MTPEMIELLEASKPKNRNSTTTVNTWQRYQKQDEEDMKMIEGEG